MREITVARSRKEPSTEKASSSELIHNQGATGI
jgi:hypothetical protein